MNIVFFDGQCDFCRKMVYYLIKEDCKKRLYFAPLLGKTAKKYHITETISIVLLDEKQKQWNRSKALSKIFSKLDKPILSKLFLLPGTDIIYSWIARHREKLSGPVAKRKEFSDRFLS